MLDKVKYNSMDIYQAKNHLIFPVYFHCNQFYLLSMTPFFFLVILDERDPSNKTPVIPDGTLIKEWKIMTNEINKKKNSEISHFLILSKRT